MPELWRRDDNELANKLTALPYSLWSERYSGAPGWLESQAKRTSVRDAGLKAKMGCPNAAQRANEKSPVRAI